MPLAALRRLSARLVDRLVAADPARSRLRLAARALLAIALTMAVLWGIGTAVALPAAAYGLGLILAFDGTLGVREAGLRRQMGTRALAALTGAAAAVLGGALAPWPLVADLGFLVVIFASVYIRRYGMRWLAVGVMAFVAYFMGDYMRPAPADAGLLLLAAAVALAAAQLASALLLPDQPERDFRRALRTIDHRINLILDHLRRAAEAGALPADDERTIRAQMVQFREIVLMAEGYVPQISGSDWALTGAAADLAAALVELLLAVERLVRYRHAALPPAAALRALLEAEGPALRAAPRADPATAGAALQLLEEVRRARGRINAALGPTPSAAFAGGGRPAPAAQQAALGPARAGVPAAFHRPLQVTLACGLALAAGYALSPVRWYWAVITAYIVFNNTRTRADTLQRTAARAGGTMGGVIAGTLLATLLQGHPLALWGGIPIALFLAVYYLQASYGMMVFFFTVALALLYGLLGMFTPGLLLLRLEETVVGGLCGAAAAFLVFPVRTGGAVEGAFRAFLDALGALIAGAAARAAGQEAPLTGASLRLDQSYGALAVAVRPLGGPWSVVTRFGEVRTKLLLLVSCAHWARVLAGAMAEGGPMGGAERARIAELAAEAERHLARLRSGAGGWFLAGPTPGLGEAALPSPSAGELKRAAAIGALETINDLLSRAVAQMERG